MICFLGFFIKTKTGTLVEPIHICRGKGAIRFQEPFSSTPASRRSTSIPKGPFKIIYDLDWAESGRTITVSVPKLSNDKTFSGLIHAVLMKFYTIFQDH